MTINNQWVLVKRPTFGHDLADCFQHQSHQLSDLKDGQYLIKNTLLSFDPTQRMWMAADTYMPIIPLNTTMRSLALGTVVASKNSHMKEGMRVSGLFGWQEYATRDQDDLAFDRVIPEGISDHAALSVFGLTGLTAYFGMMDIGHVKAGDVVLVSGASGATGSIAAQIAKVSHAKKVIGIAGGEKKCAWLKDQAKIHAAIDYKSEDLFERLREEAPDGIDLFFDNVGGSTLDMALANLNLNARVVLCGAISTYGGQDGAINNYRNLVLKRASMTGFLVFDHMHDIERAFKDLSTWVMSGQVAYEVDIETGFENAPKTIERLFSGQNFGKQLLRI